MVGSEKHWIVGVWLALVIFYDINCTATGLIHSAIEINCIVELTLLLDVLIQIRGYDY